MSDGKKGDEPLEMISLTQLMRMLDQGGSERGGDTGDIEDTQGSGPTPRVTRMPDGFEVLEQRVGRAVGHWVLQVRCECGRRWFEVEAVESSTCPRCGAPVRQRRIGQRSRFFCPRCK